MPGFGDFFGGFANSFGSNLSHMMQNRRANAELQMRLREEQRQQASKKMMGEILLGTGGRGSPLMGGGQGQPQMPPGMSQGPMPQAMSPGQPSQPMQQPGRLPTQQIQQPGMMPQQPPQDPRQSVVQAAIKNMGVSPDAQRISQVPGRGVSAPPGAAMQQPQGGGAPSQGGALPRIAQMLQGQTGSANPHLPGMGGPPIRGAFHPVDVVPRYESGGKNVMNYINDRQHTAGGFWQITNTNWNAYGPRVGIDTSKYPTAISAPYSAQREVAKKMYDEQGYGPWAPYNPKLRAALAKGDMSPSVIHEAAALNPEGPEGSLVSQTSEGKSFLGQAGRGQLDWRTAVQAIMKYHPGAKPEEVADAITGLLPVMSQDSTAQWRDIQAQLRTQGLNIRADGQLEKTQHNIATEKQGEEKNELSGERLALSRQRLEASVADKKARLAQLKEQYAGLKDYRSMVLKNKEIDQAQRELEDAERQQNAAIGHQEALGATPEIQRSEAARAGEAGTRVSKFRERRESLRHPGTPPSGTPDAAAPPKKAPSRDLTGPPTDDKKKDLSAAPKELKDKLEAAQQALKDGTTTREDILTWFKDRGYDVTPWI